MKIFIRNDSVTIEGYVNAVERNSKPLNERGVTFIERIKAGAFKRAIERAKDIRILLNHDERRDLGGTADGNLELEEDNIGLKARAVISDPEVIEEARKGDLVGWSFGFLDNDVTQMRDEETGYPLRKVNDLTLREVSILNRKKSPAYAGTLVNVRDIDGEVEKVNISDDYAEAVELIDLSEDETVTRSDESGEVTVEEITPEEAGGEAIAEAEPAQAEITSETLARYKNIIAELKS